MRRSKATSAAMKACPHSANAAFPAILPPTPFPLPNSPAARYAPALPFSFSPRTQPAVAPMASCVQRPTLWSTRDCAKPSPPPCPAAVARPGRALLQMPAAANITCRVGCVRACMCVGRWVGGWEGGRTGGRAWVMNLKQRLAHRSLRTRPCPRPFLFPQLCTGIDTDAHACMHCVCARSQLD